MRPIVIDDLSVTRLRCAKTAERIGILLGVDILGEQHNRHIALDGEVRCGLWQITLDFVYFDVDCMTVTKSSAVADKPPDACVRRCCAVKSFLLMNDCDLLSGFCDSRSFTGWQLLTAY